MVERKNQAMNDIDARLKEPDQEAVRHLIGALPDDGVSMSWRSSLNESLLKEAAKQNKRQRVWWLLRPAIGLSLATVLAVVVMVQPTQHRHAVAPDHGIESALLMDHHNSVLLSEVSSAGLNASEVTTEANPKDPDDGIWNDSDVQSL